MRHILITTLLASSTLLASANDSVHAGASPEKHKETPMPVTIVIDTSLGTLKAELYPEQAPVTVSNFLAYADAEFYNGTIFHRVIPNFMIQGGGFNPDMSQKPTQPPIRNEAANGLKNERGTLAMARTQIVDSATCQFFINHKANDFLNHRNTSPQGFGYCVFGKVIDGLDVLDKIAAVPTATHPGGHGDVPVEPVLIISITREAGQ